MLLPLKVIGTLGFETVALTPPTGTILLTLTTTILYGAQIKTPTSAVPPPTGIFDS